MCRWHAVGLVRYRGLGSGGSSDPLDPSLGTGLGLGNYSDLYRPTLLFDSFVILMFICCIRWYVFGCVQLYMYTCIQL